MSNPASTSLRYLATSRGPTKHPILPPAPVPPASPVDPRFAGIQPSRRRPENVTTVVGPSLGRG